MARNILKSSMQNASFGIIFQILFRIITLILNAYIIRTVGQDVLGIMNVRLLLLESTILFLSKEPILKACLTDTRSHNWGQVINQIWLSVPFCAILSYVLVHVWINVLSPTEPIYQIQYNWGCYAVALSCIIEQITQIPLLVAQSFCFGKLKIAFETIYIIGRTIIFVIFVNLRPDQAINAFSVAQISSATILCACYYLFFAWYIRKFAEIKSNPTSNQTGRLFSDMADFPFRSAADFLPKRSANSSLVNGDLLKLTISFAKQSLIKQILTEGERYVMTVSPVLTFSQQSVYNIVNNLGSLAVRLIFRPIEENAYFYFTQMIKRNERLSVQEKKLVSESAQVLQHLCKIVVSIGLVAVVFGQSYSWTVLYLFGGPKLVENDLPVVLLRWHSFAVLLFAINGVTEGFVFATMSNKQLDRYNYVMVIFSISFLLMAYVLTNIFGAVGFILANCCNMLARCVHSLIYINRMYEKTNYKPLQGLYPNRKFTLILIISGIITKYSELLQHSLLVHIGIGALFIFATLLVWAYENQSLMKLGYDKYKRKMSLKTS